MIHKLYTALVVGNQKAIMAFVLTALAVALAKVGLNLDMTLRQAGEAVLSALVVGLGTWLKANNK